MTDRTQTPPSARPYREFVKRREGMIHAMDGGLWLHRHVLRGERMAHLVSTDRERLLAYGRMVGLPERRLQFKPLRDPRTGERRDCWHWDLLREFLPPPADHTEADREGKLGGDDGTGDAPGR